MKLSVYSGAACLPLLVSSYCAADEAAQLPTTVVTATRTEQSVDDSLASVTVIERNEIERRQAQSVQDVLRGVPGLALSNDGGLGKNTSVFLRGTNSDHVLVLIDGIRAGSATLGTTAFQNLPVDQIERIEIVRGPRASLYGSEAIGGVIQIFTRKGSQSGIKPYVSFGAGSHGLYRTTGGVSGGDGKGWYSFNGSRLETRGFNSTVGSAETDHDGYRNTAGNARAGYRFDNGLEIEGNLLHSEFTTDFDQAEFDPKTYAMRETFNNLATGVQQMLGGSVKYAPTDFWTTTVRAGRTLDEAKWFNTRTDVNNYRTQRINTTWQNDFTVAAGHLLSLGLDYYVDKVDSDVAYALKSRDDKAGFIQYQASLGAWDGVFGARYDDNEQFGSRPTGNAMLGYTFDNGIRLSGGWGNAFKAPSFNQLYYPNYGNPKLLPENSESWEAGVDGRHWGVKWSVRGYHTEVDNLINTVCDINWMCTAANVDRARILGLETQASTQLLGFDVAANLNLTDARNLTPGADHNNALARRPKSMFRFDVDRRFLDRFSLGASVYGDSRRFDDAANTQAVHGFVTVDLRATASITKELSLEGRVANLLDKNYRTSGRYYQDDRNFLVSLRYQPEL